jgi:hypothetical protein
MVGMNAPLYRSSKAIIFQKRNQFLKSPYVICRPASIAGVTRNV